jgi:hypothetical protein
MEGLCRFAGSSKKKKKDRRSLTEGMVKAMLMTKLRVTAAYLVLIGAVALGSGTIAHRTLAGDTTDSSLAAARAETPLVPPAELPEQERAQRPAKDEVTVAGELEAVDADKKRVTIATFKRGEGKSEKTFSVAKDAKILRDGKEAKLGDLKTGSKATLKLTADQKTVVSISVDSPPLSAPLKSVDASKNTITVIVGARGAKEDKTYQVAKDAKITIDGQEAKLADLSAGTSITFTLNSSDTVIQVRTQAQRDRKQGK